MGLKGKLRGAKGGGSLWVKGADGKFNGSLPGAKLAKARGRLREALARRKEVEPSPRIARKVAFHRKAVERAKKVDPIIDKGPAPRVPGFQKGRLRAALARLREARQRKHEASLESKSGKQQKRAIRLIKRDVARQRAKLAAQAKPGTPQIDRATRLGRAQQRLAAATQRAAAAKATLNAGRAATRSAVKTELKDWNSKAGSADRYGATRVTREARIALQTSAEKLGRKNKRALRAIKLHQREVNRLSRG